MKFNAKVQEALLHVRRFAPHVTQVFYGSLGAWRYCNEAFSAPCFSEFETLDVGLLREASEAAFKDRGHPSGYRLATLEEVYDAWVMLADLPVSGPDEAIPEEFLGYPAGTPRKDIERWFTEIHPDFCLSEGMARVNA